MANIEHAVVADPNIHEPKGVAAATTGFHYQADGAGSGTWLETPYYSHRIGSIKDNTTSTDDLVLTATADFNAATGYLQIICTGGFIDDGGRNITLTGSSFDVITTGLYNTEAIFSVELIAGTGNVNFAFKTSNTTTSAGLHTSKSLHTLDFLNDIRTFSGSSLRRYTAGDSIAYFVAADTNSTVRIREARISVSRVGD